MTLTERKRKARPMHYARKDARQRIYRELYGAVGEIKGKRSNVPALDETRRMSSFWTYQNALHVFEANRALAEFTSNEIAVLERRLEQLRHYKPKTSTEREVSEIIDTYVSTL